MQLEKQVYESKPGEKYGLKFEFFSFLHPDLRQQKGKSAATGNKTGYMKRSRS